MNQRISTGCCREVLAGLAIVILSMFPMVAVGADEGKRVDGHLAAGEFGPAMQIAGGVADDSLRDDLFQRIAAAQATSGARQASLITASAISTDDLRQSTLRDVSGRWFAAPGGAALADFDTLIDLITSTIAPTTWDDNGGPGAVDGFPGGVFVDSEGVMKTLPLESGGTSLARIRDEALITNDNRDLNRSSTLRKVSLRRLERQLEILSAQGAPPSEAMRSLAGIHQVTHLFVYPQAGDIVIAGPAGSWTTDAEGRRVNTASGAPVLQLDDFVVVLRNAFSDDPRFGCSITPTQENLARTREYLQQSTAKPITEGGRERWLRGLRENMGQQEISVFGIDAGTRVAKVLVEADYRMKLVGMGLEDGVLGVESYLDSITVQDGQSPPPMNVLRWWFTLNYEAIRTTDARDAFQIHGQGVKVLSENELLTQQGQRVHTGASDELTSRFAHDFTRHFPQLAKKYPIYAELRNVFDLALLALLMRQEDLPTQVGWTMAYFDPQDARPLLRYQPQRGQSPELVDTIVNHRVIRGKRVQHVIAGVSGGVSFDGRALVSHNAIAKDTYGLLPAERAGSKPESDDTRWWWD